MYHVTMTKSFSISIYIYIRLINLTFLLTVFKVFDEDNDSNINMKEWVCGFSKFLRGTNKEKMDCKYWI